MQKISHLIAIAVSVVTVGGLTISLNINSASVAWAGANPNPVVSASVAPTGDRYVFWTCNGYTAICEVHYDPVTKRWAKQPDLRVGQIVSPPSVSVSRDPLNGGIYVFWAGGARHDLYEDYWTGRYDLRAGRWHGPFNLHMGPLLSAPAAPGQWYDQRVTGTKEAVAWMGLGNRLRYAYSASPTNPRSWRGPFTRNVGTIASPPGVTDAGGGAVSAWWKGNNGQLYSASLVADEAVPYGPCDFGMGRLYSMPSAIWGPGLPVVPEATAGAGASHVRIGKAALAGLRGNCPRPASGLVWFGRYGGYGVCWAGSSGLRCMEWAVTGDASSGDGQVVVAGPFEEGRMGILGSSPSLGYYPGTYVCSPSGCQFSQAYAFWQGSNLKQDLIEADATTNKGPYDLGFGPLTSF